MKSRIVVSVGLAVVLTVCLVGTVFAANTMVVQSRDSIEIGSLGVTVGVYIENDEYLTGLTVPLEIRAITVGSFPSANFTFEPVSTGRVGMSGLTDFETNVQFPTPTDVDTLLCSGPVSSSFPIGGGAVDFVSPDAVFWSGVNIFSPCLAPGSDGPPGSANPSFLFTFDVSMTPGTFEIDTCCVTPANHLVFVATDTLNDGTGGFDISCNSNSLVPITPSFTKGTVTIVLPSAVQEVGGVLPTTFSVDQNYPNPFNAGTIIPFSVAYDSHVRIDIYDILGRRIATVADDEYTVGNYSADWDGRDKNGSVVATGVYFYRFVSDEMTETRKMVVLK